MGRHLRDRRCLAAADAAGLCGRHAEGRRGLGQQWLRQRSASAQPQRSSSQVAADSAISTSVRSRLAANTALKGLNIGVDTHDGVVTLRGQVAKVEQKMRPRSSARTVKGVRSVQNLLTVR